MGDGVGQRPWTTSVVSALQARWSQMNSSILPCCSESLDHQHKGTWRCRVSLSTCWTHRAVTSRTTYPPPPLVYLLLEPEASACFGMLQLGRQHTYVGFQTSASHLSGFQPCPRLRAGPPLGKMILIRPIETELLGSFAAQAEVSVGRPWM